MLLSTLPRDLAAIAIGMRVVLPDGRCGYVRGRVFGVAADGTARIDGYRVAVPGAGDVLVSSVGLSSAEVAA